MIGWLYDSMSFSYDNRADEHMLTMCLLIKVFGPAEEAIKYRQGLFDHALFLV